MVSDKKKKSFDVEKFKNEMTKMIEIKFCPTYNKIIYGVYTFSFLFTILIIISLSKIEQISCDCANIPDKKLIKEWFIFSLIFNFIILIAFILSDKACYFYMTNNAIPYVLISLVQLISFVMLIRLIAYLNILRKGCECGYGKLENFLFWYLVVALSIIALFIIGILIIGIFGIIKTMYQ